MSIGRFYIRKKKPWLTDCLEFTVTQTEGTTYQLKVQMRLVSPLVFNSIKSGRISSFLNTEQFITEVFFASYEEKMYLVQVIDEQRVRAKIDFSSMKITPYIYRRLMTQTLTTLDDLHDHGIKLAQQLHKYLQVEIIPGRLQQQQISMIKFTTEQNFPMKDFKWFCSQKEKYVHSDEMTRTELYLVLQFYEQLIKKGGSYTTSSTKNIMHFLDKAQYKHRNDIGVQHLRSQVNLMKAQYMQFKLEGRLEAQSSLLVLRIKDRFNFNLKENTKEFRLKGFILVDNREELLHVNELFFNLATLERDEIKIVSLNKIAYFDKRTTSWLLFTFTNESNEKSYDQFYPGFEARSNSDDLQSNNFAFQFNEDQAKIQSSSIPSALFPKITPSIAQNDLYPYNCIGLIINFGRQFKAMTGTGTLVDSNLVLTAAHNVYSMSPDKQFQKIWFTWKDKTIFVKKSICPRRYLDKRELCYDYALLLLSQQVKLQRYPLLAGNYNKTDNLEFISFEKKENMNCLKVEKNCEPIQLGNQHFLKHRIKTCKGQSGSPIIAKLSDKDQSYCIVGIHKSATINMDGSFKEGTGIRMTNQIVESIAEMSKEIINSSFSSEKYQLINLYTDYLALSLRKTPKKTKVTPNIKY